MTIAEVLIWLREEASKSGGVRAWCEARKAEGHLVSSAAAYRALNGREPPGDGLLAAMGLRRKPTEYEEIG